ncbi:hypothetical protein T484DRAFT_1891274 [Baffinella frigidus]|nr:hypothetical protein T484DRAFT_1891274 [Cryptophyta sp. CCMP2293]|mmetsp:Transcript_14590/g.32622  ORF Transcript_14590/g.32622 Transcript_14590/m.32622 type:complete len:169 (-) Transcript_14590:85-591(-)|eukprot:CAMPEP_0180218264 /NCGR_PEP_ID=MMETSP0987-20121128/17552_1 /TAXON_ID=697907 /ORGANISM="non described non described, Strain CCMP2293" /LENGTH=168 /DNA_ID=CAMNT_0022178209 /DNA_START=50 /DNA_END=556 /DNA_ORIENTATION=-
MACSLPEGPATDAPDDHSAGEKRHRHSPEDVEDWQPGAGLDTDACLHPQAWRSRLAATSLLYERLVQQTATIHAHVIKRRRQDILEREVSLRIANRHPIRPLADASVPLRNSAPLRSKSISCELASPPSDEDSAVPAAWSASVRAEFLGGAGVWSSTIKSLSEESVRG